MSRKSTSMQCLGLICESKAMDERLIMERAESLLKLYRHIASVVLADTEMTVNESSTYYAGNDTFVEDIKAGLSYLADFEPVNKIQDFEAKVVSLFETEWLIELMHIALERVRGYLGKDGGKYYDILFKSYFDNHEYTTDELFDIVGIARTTFFKKRREAILLFGIYFWGYGIPDLYRGLFGGDSEYERKAD